MGVDASGDRYLEFVHLDLFRRTADGLLTDDDLHALEDELLENPEKGSVQAGTGGVRKVRVSIGSTGKRGGARAV